MRVQNVQNVQISVTKLFAALIGYLFPSVGVFLLFLGGSYECTNNQVFVVRTVAVLAFDSDLLSLVIYPLVLNDDFLVPWWAEVHIFICFMGFLCLFYTTPTCILPHSPPNQSHFLSLHSWGYRLLPHLRKRTFSTFWSILQYLCSFQTRQSMRPL